MSADRVVYSMILGWIVLIAVLILLDWLANPNRGSFRPKGEHRPRDRRARREARARERLEDDASVRAALRDAYGASSLRLSWNEEKESEARGLDDSLVRPDSELVDAIDTRSREVDRLDPTRILGDPLPNPEELSPDEFPPDGAGADTSEPEPDEETELPAATRAAEPVPRAVGWRVGADPLSLTAKGAEPTPATVRARAWKNHAAHAVWDDENRDRLRNGRPPVRVNPMTGRTERATVDADTGRASWGSEPVDPFGTPS